MEETKQENKEMAEGPAQSPPVERVTEKVKDHKRWQPGVPALPPKRQSKKNDLEQLRASKESFHPSAGEGMSANIPPKEAAAVSADKRPERREGLTNWTPWVVGACLAGRALLFLRNAQTRSPASVAAAPIDSAPKQPAPGAKQLKTQAPFYME